MNVDAQAVVTQLGEDYATDLASKTQQIALLKVQVKTLQDQLNSQKEGDQQSHEG